MTFVRGANQVCSKGWPLMTLPKLSPKFADRGRVWGEFGECLGENDKSSEQRVPTLRTAFGWRHNVDGLKDLTRNLCQGGAHCQGSPSVWFRSTPKPGSGTMRQGAHSRWEMFMLDRCNFDTRSTLDAPWCKKTQKKSP